MSDVESANANTALVTTEITANDHPQQLIEHSQFGKARKNSLLEAFTTDVMNHIEDGWLNHEFVFDEATQLKVMTLAATGMNLEGIAAGIGIGKSHFKELRGKEKDPNQVINRCIQVGRYVGKMKLLEKSWAAVDNLRDNSRPQELARLYKLLEAEDANVTEGAKIEKTAEGFTLTVIEKKESTDGS